MPLFHPAARRAFVLGFALVTMAAHGADGDLDAAFGAGGMARTGAANTALNAMAVRPDGRIVVCGSATLDNGHPRGFLVAQYLSGGLRDPAFGDHGVTSIDLGDYEDACTALAIQPDGRIVLAGYTSTPQFPGGSYSYPVVARLALDGTLDTSFGSGGSLKYPHGGYADGVALQADGKIVLAGTAYSDDMQRTDFEIVRLLPDGTPDPIFGVDGRVLVDFDTGAPYNIAAAVAIDREQRIVVAGSNQAWAPSQIGVARLLPSGDLDTTFGTGGMTIIDPDSAATMSGRALALLRDGRILVAGELDSDGGQWTMMVARLLEDGSTDTTFGTRGIAVMPTQTAWQTSAYGLAVQSDGKCLLAGSARDPDDNFFSAIARINTDGQPDAAFGNGGLAVLDLLNIADAYQNLTAVAISGGLILAAGVAGDSNVSADVLIRLQNDLIFADAF